MDFFEKKDKFGNINFFSNYESKVHMPNLPFPIINVLAIFSPLFSKPTFRKFLTLFHAHILCKGFRTVTGLLKRLGLRNDKNFSNYYDFFNKNKWSAFKELARLKGV